MLSHRAPVTKFQEENSSQFAAILYLTFLWDFRKAAILGLLCFVYVLIGYIVQPCQVLRFNILYPSEGDLVAVVAGFVA
jgi:cell shape-determining protein MreD